MDIEWLRPCLFWLYRVTWSMGRQIPFIKSNSIFLKLCIVYKIQWFMRFEQEIAKCPNIFSDFMYLNHWNCKTSQMFLKAYLETPALRSGRVTRSGSWFGVVRQLWVIACPVSTVCSSICQLFHFYFLILNNTFKSLLTSSQGIVYSKFFY